MSPKRKVTLYFNSGMLAETQREAIRQDRSVSWIIQASWRLAREDVRRLPGVGALSPATGAAIADGDGDGDGDDPVPPATVTRAAPPRRPIRE
jgi:uncharacterized small protein (TIGR04563 family)